MPHQQPLLSKYGMDLTLHKYQVLQTEMNIKVQNGFKRNAVKLSMSHWAEDNLHLLDIPYFNGK